MPHSVPAMPCMVPEMKTALRTYILKQRQKKKEEAELDEAIQNERKRMAEKKLHDLHTMEEVNMQIHLLEVKLAELKQEKHDLFAQLKKVLNQENEQRKRIQQIQQQHVKEANEVLAKVGPAAPPLPMPAGGSPSDTVSSIQHSSLPIEQHIKSTVPMSPSTPTKRIRSPSPGRDAHYTKRESPYQGSFSKTKVSPIGAGSSGSSNNSGGGVIMEPRTQRIPQTMLSPNPMISPPGMGSGSVPFPTYVQGMPSPSMGSPDSQQRSFRPPIHQHDGRQISPHQTPPMPHISPNSMAGIPPSHIPRVGIPVVAPQKQMGSITAGFPVHKPPGPIPGFQRPYFGRGSFPSVGSRFM